MYGMGEHQIKELCTRLANGENIREIHDIRGTCYMTEPVNTPIGSAQCPSFEQVRDSKKEYAKATKIQYDWQGIFCPYTILFQIVFHMRHDGNWLSVRPHHEYSP